MNSHELGLEVIAGHCSFSNEPGQLDELSAIANTRVLGSSGESRLAVSYVRFVTLKSCTDAKNPGIGLDAEAVGQIMSHPKSRDDIDLPGIKLAAQFAREEKVGVAAEIMIPHLQLAQYEKHLAGLPFFPWMPSSVILGWVAQEIDHWCTRNGWPLGIKNPKWLGTTLEQAESPAGSLTSMQRSWEGLATFISDDTDYVFINRGVDVPEKNSYRNAITHEIARRVKRNNPHKRLGIDLNHACGPNHRNEIASSLVHALLMTVDDRPLSQGGVPLYDMLLAEVGTKSITDAGQHLTVDEFRDTLKEVSKHRIIKDRQESYDRA